MNYKELLCERFGAEGWTCFTQDSYGVKVYNDGEVIAEATSFEEMFPQEDLG